MRGMTDVFWTNLVIVVAALLALISLWKKYDIVFALVIIWAFIGIILKRLGAEIIYPNIIWTLGISIAIITGGI
ncbi:TPA: hypothetical protein DIC40_00315 [Patescibacteria group bacterium]|nr:hypothetical protein [Candidatus Gracilibacteria bacterium]